MVVDDSVVVRRLVSDILAGDDGLEVVGSAANGRIALSKLDALKPDVVTMDVEMPELDGVETVREMRAAGYTMPIIMFSTLTDRGAAATLDALAAGASDYVTKPANVGSVGRSMDQVRSSLIPKIKGLAAGAPSPSGTGITSVGRSSTRAPLPTHASTPASPGPASVTRAAPASPFRLATRTSPVGGYKILVVGSSTGGPEAVTRFLGALPPLPVPVAIVQHMPALFTRQFAARLDRQLGPSVTETVPGQRLDPGTITIAPGDFHLHLTGTKASPVARLSQEQPENYCRPAVDVLFRTAAQVYGAQVLAVVLTGMGQDGCRGARSIVDAGGSVLAQDQATSVVWGMPGAVATAGLAEEVLPLPALATAVAQRLTASFVGGAR
jgi:two-component system chemotaxis response regulator CheB